MPQPSSFESVKIFSATTARDRDALGNRITCWLADHAGAEILERQVLQSSDERFHCLTIVFFYNDASVTAPGASR